MTSHFKAYKYALTNHLQECSTASVLPPPANSTSSSRQDAESKQAHPWDSAVAAFSTTFA